MQEAVIDGVNRWHNEGTPIPSGELSLVGKNSAPVHVYSSHVMITNNRNEEEMFCIDVDLTERKLVKEALSKSEEKYRHLFEMESDAIFLIETMTGNILEVNQTT